MSAFIFHAVLKSFVFLLFKTN